MEASLNLFHKAVKSGAELLFLVERLEDDVEAERRLSVCKSQAGTCYEASSDRCMECGCFMSVKSRMLKHRNAHAGLRVEVTHCPLAKWGREKELEIVNHYRRLDGKEPLKLQ